VAHRIGEAAEASRSTATIEQAFRMAEHRFCTVADEGRVRVVTINRPEVMNALHSEAHWEFDAVWNEFAANP
jgi:enoyl-CoA hydratase/carnithine racemase